MKCICDGCGETFELSADDRERPPEDKVAVLAIRSCDSGGIYATYVECPHCGRRHDL